MGQQAKELLVMNAGIGKSGTRSIQRALEILYGEPCYHISSAASDHPDHIPKLIEIFEKMEADSNFEISDDDVHFLIKGYKTISENPLCMFYRNILKMYPNIKVILVIRDTQSWLRCVRASIFPRDSTVVPQTFFDRLAQRFILGKGYLELGILSMRCALGFDCPLNDDEGITKGYKNWNEQVRKTVPAENLLIFNLGEGWRPICQFLNLPVPDCQFPHSNEREQYMKRFHRISRLSMLFRLAAYGTIGIMLGIAGYWFTGRFEGKL
ncbi:unnamed protein product [Calicophoron daubneyi]|uniref:Sulfotransferase n=1 Tax=Calicophoron daubneyi TaxID=300641 RepID=A0AAV2TVC0_CALDB